MTDFNRRQFMGTGMLAGAAIITPDMALAGASPAGWASAVADVEADIPEEVLTLVSGKVPAGFNTTLYRNGPAKFRRGSSAAGHWFDGDGLVRKFRVRDGKASLAARFVDTPKRRLETKLNAIVQPGFGTAPGAGSVLNGPDDTNAANTSVMMSGGQLLALWEGGSPVMMDPETLETKGFKTYRRDLKSMPFLAHPRVEPDGTVWNLGGNGKGTFVWKLNPDGSLAQAKINLDVEAPVSGASVAIFYSSGMVFAVSAGVILLRDLWLVLSGRVADADLVMVKESEEAGELEALQAELAREQAAGSKP